MKARKYIDLHCHSLLSDGVYEPDEVIRRAHENGICVLSITDHNYATDLSNLHAEREDMHLIQGAEVSCKWEAHEIHIVALGFDVENAHLQDVLRQNRQFDRKSYIAEILAKLRECGIDLGNFEDVAAEFPGVENLGRMHIARLLHRRNITSSVTEALDRYVGDLGQRLAYVPTQKARVTMEEAIGAIREAGGVAVLAHPFLCRLEEGELRNLLQRFAALAGEDGAIEVYYPDYDAAQRLTLLRLSREYGLLVSAGSDWHGNAEQHFSQVLAIACTPLLNRLGVEFSDPPQKLAVISGFSGVGKGTLVSLLPPDQYRVVRSHTTRSRRGPDDFYHFNTKEEFEEMAANDVFLEYASYGGHYYGTPRKAVDAILAEGLIPVLEIDRQGLLRIYTEGQVDPAQVQAIFVLASPQQLITRLVARGTEDDGKILKRLEATLEESQSVENLYDFFVYNTTIDAGLEQLKKALAGECTDVQFNAEAYAREMRKLLSQLYAEGIDRSFWSAHNE